MTVTPAPDIPLDVYILMDFSASTRDDLQVLQQIAHEIGDGMQGAGGGWGFLVR